MGERKKTIIQVIESGVANLQKNVEIVNDLNVFPVPDGDTGSNMLATVMGGLNAIKPDMDDDIEIMEAFAKGCLMAARGNSGVITSQIIRGFVEGVVKSNGLSSKAENLSDVIKSAKERSYGAVAEPVEGTILTVIRLIDERFERGSKSMVEAFGQVLKIAEEATEETPDMLPVLKQAGVVDSGAYGLTRIIEGIYLALQGQPLRIHTHATTKVEKTEVVDVNDVDPNKNIGYCTEVVLKMKEPNMVSQEETVSFLETIGDSIAVVIMDDVLKFHVHTKTPAKAFEWAHQYGEFAKIKSDNMATQVEHNDAEFARENKINPKQLGIIAISNGEGINQLFEELKVDKIVFGGQSMNPSVEDIQQAVDSLPNEEIIILPNNSNIILTADAVAKNSDRKITVLPTKSIQQGLVSLYNLSKEMTPFEDYKEAVEESFKDIPEGSITYAVRDTEMDGVEIKRDEFMAIMKKSIIASNVKRMDSFKALLDAIVKEDPEEITLIHNDDISKDELEEMKELLDKTGIDYEVYFGGQEVYSILMFGEY